MHQHIIMLYTYLYKNKNLNLIQECMFVDSGFIIIEEFTFTELEDWNFDISLFHSDLTARCNGQLFYLNLIDFILPALRLGVGGILWYNVKLHILANMANFQQLTIEKAFDVTFNKIKCKLKNRDMYIGADSTDVSLLNSYFSPIDPMAHKFTRMGLKIVTLVTGENTPWNGRTRGNRVVNYPLGRVLLITPFFYPCITIITICEHCLVPWGVHTSLSVWSLVNLIIYK